MHILEKKKKKKKKKLLITEKLRGEYFVSLHETVQGKLGIKNTHVKKKKKKKKKKKRNIIMFCLDLLQK